MIKPKQHEVWVTEADQDTVLRTRRLTWRLNASFESKERAYREVAWYHVHNYFAEVR